MSNEPAANMASLGALCDDLCETESATVDRRQLCEWLSAMQAQAHDIERLAQQCAALQSAINCGWTDRADDLSAEIDITHPFKLKDFERWNRAQVLVSNRHSKGALIALVAYLLRAEVERDALRALVSEALPVWIEWVRANPPVYPAPTGFDWLTRAHTALGETK